MWWRSRSSFQLIGASHNLGFVSCVCVSLRSCRNACAISLRPSVTPVSVTVQSGMAGGLRKGLLGNHHHRIVAYRGRLVRARAVVLSLEFAYIAGMAFGVTRYMRNRTLPILVFTLAAMALCGCAPTRWLAAFSPRRTNTCLQLRGACDGGTGECRPPARAQDTDDKGGGRWRRAACQRHGLPAGIPSAARPDGPASQDGRREKLQSFEGRQRGGSPTRRTDKAVRRARPNTTTSYRIYAASVCRALAGAAKLLAMVAVSNTWNFSPSLRH